MAAERAERRSSFVQVRRHVRHHIRFYLAIVLGVLVWAPLASLDVRFSLVAAGDCFFAAYLIAAGLFVRRATPEDIRERARYADEGIIVIVLITLAAVVLSLWSMFLALSPRTAPSAAGFGFTIASVVLSWLTLHTILANRYAHLFYARAEPPGRADDHDAIEDEADRQDARGLHFPSTDEPSLWDFLYFAFVVGMTMQVSDVAVLSGGLRRLVLFHSIVSFFFNTVLLALAINIAAGAIQK